VTQRRLRIGGDRTATRPSPAGVYPTPALPGMGKERTHAVPLFRRHPLDDALDCLAVHFALFAQGDDQGVEDMLMFEEHEQPRF
jgi:hypothetical protein